MDPVATALKTSKTHDPTAAPAPLDGMAQRMCECTDVQHTRHTRVEDALFRKLLRELDQNQKPVRVVSSHNQSDKTYERAINTPSAAPHPPAHPCAE